MAQDGLWHLEKSRARAENGKKRNFPALGVPKSKKTSYHAIRDGCPQPVYILRFGRPDPHGQEIAKYGYFRPFWPRTALGTYGNPGAGPKTEKCNFLVLGALFGKTSGRPKSFSPKVRNFFTFYVFADGSPTGEKSQNTGVLGHFGLGRPLALR